MKLPAAIVLSLILISMFSLSWAQIEKKQSITVNEFREMMKTDSNLVVLDVRNPQELKDKTLGHIEGVINIPVQVLESRIKELDDYKDKDIAVICRSGRRSKIATEILLKYGFNAFNVEGGMIKYRATEKK
ncbi:thiosulfate sulfurtransferase PspE precursor [bacterium BMS3Abin03]|nr:thiosulfate sulfurtransferase PspE precursor [bacterium BMS3Abin03]